MFCPVFVHFHHLHLNLNSSFSLLSGLCPHMIVRHALVSCGLTQASLKRAHFEAVVEGRAVERRWYQFRRHLVSPNRNLAKIDADAERGTNDSISSFNRNVFVASAYFNSNNNKTVSLKFSCQAAWKLNRKAEPKSHDSHTTFKMDISKVAGDGSGGRGCSRCGRDRTVDEVYTHIISNTFIHLFFDMFLVGRTSRTS